MTDTLRAIHQCAVQAIREASGPCDTYEDAFRQRGTLEEALQCIAVLSGEPDGGTEGGVPPDLRGRWRTRGGQVAIVGEREGDHWRGAVQGISVAWTDTCECPACRAWDLKERIENGGSDGS